ncbi:MAG: hypothetical protein JO297_21190 [Nitrososphaeraceae archaeon]|nr:hypothetical protein [Nitrososphaeraceae archaeon]
MKIQINNNRKISNTDSNDKAQYINEERDMELENIVGNMMIAQYQVDKLRSRLSERISGYGSASNKKASAHMFRHNDKWYKVTIKVDETTTHYPEVDEDVK